MSGAAAGMPQDPKGAFKAEWEALQVASHNHALANADAALALALKAPPSHH